MISDGGETYDAEQRRLIIRECVSFLRDVASEKEDQSGYGCLGCHSPKQAVAGWLADEMEEKLS